MLTDDKNLNDNAAIKDSVQPKTSLVGVRPKADSAPAIKLSKSAQAPSKTKDTTLACRYELKYRISESKARAIANFLKPYLHLDRYAQLRPGGEYPITSLYLDSDDLKLCKETLYKKKNRFKLRVRGYSDNPDTPVFFEIKRRINTVIMKSRARGLHKHVAPVLAGRDISGLDIKTDEKALRQFQFYLKILNARPMVLVRYMRQAFEGDSDNRVRITFDRKLSYNITRNPKVQLEGTGWQRVPLDFVVLEIKFTSKYPAWISTMAKAFNLNQTSMSKYASSVRQSIMTGFTAPTVTQGSQFVM